MTTIAWILTGLAGIVMLLTRARLNRSRTHSGVSQLPGWITNAHTLCVLLSCGPWFAWCFRLGTDELKYLALVFLWLTAIIGLMILQRWFTGRGRHVTGPARGDWRGGPTLSIIAHGGYLVGVAAVTYMMIAKPMLLRH